MKHRPGGAGGSGGGGAPRRRKVEGLSLSAFAGAKTSTYDKRARLERERALNSKKARPACRRLQCGAASRVALWRELGGRCGVLTRRARR